MREAHLIVKFGVRRPRETNPIFMLVLSKTSPNKFWRNQAEGKKTKVKICFGTKGQYIDIKQQYIHAVRLSETRPIKFWRSQAEGK